MHAAVMMAHALYVAEQPAIRALLDARPTPAAQAALLDRLRRCLRPVLNARRLTVPFVLVPGLRMRRRYGHCRQPAGGIPAEIAVRCTRDGSPGEWRRPASITSTLLHEIAHLRHDNHGARFWNLYRRLLDEAATAGIYDPADEDPKERSQGDLKLAGSVAHGVAEAARQADRERARTARAAAAQWNPGDRAVIGGSSVLAGTLVEVVARRRTRVAVATADNRRYLVPGPLLEPAIDPSTVRRDDRWHGWKPGDVALVGGRNALSGTEVRVVSRLRTRLEVVLGDGRQYLVPPGLLIRPDEVPEVLPPVAPPRMAPAASLGMSPVASLEMSPVASPEMSPAAAAQLPLFPV